MTSEHLPLDVEALKRKRSEAASVMAERQDRIAQGNHPEWKPLPSYVTLTIAETDAILAELERLRAALREIREQQGRVCSDYELCHHVACQSSYASWAIAYQTLNPSPNEVEEVRRG